MWRFFLRQNDSASKFNLKRNQLVIKNYVFSCYVPLICEINFNQIFSTLNE